MELMASDHLHTPSATAVVVSFGHEHTRLQLAPGTDFRIRSLRNGKAFELDSGEVEASVARQPFFRPMTISTPEAQVRVLGTQFTLNESTNTTTLKVITGKVRLTRKSDGETVRVLAGQYTIAGAAFELRALPMTGKISREWWTGVMGISLTALFDDPRFPNHPSGQDLVNEFEFGPVTTNHLVVRLHGFLQPPITGNYQFWLAGSGDAALLLSPTDQATQKDRIATTPGTKPRSWDETDPLRSGGTQRSPMKPLIAGRRYYIEAILLIEKGEGHFSVAWKRPGAPRELLSAQYLSPANP
jgi:hypothetical protein